MILRKWLLSTATIGEGGYVKTVRSQSQKMCSVKNKNKFASERRKGIVKQTRGECERCSEEEKLLIMSLEGMVCYQCAEEIDLEEEEEY